MNRDRLAGAASITLGAGIAANAMLGPLALGVIRIRESSAMETQLLGGELTSLFLAAPLAIVAGVLWWRGHPLAPMLAEAPAGFALYMYVQFVLVPDYSRYDGNNERFFALYLVLVILGWSLAWRAWRALGSAQLARPARGLERALGTTLIVVNAAIGLAWVASIARVLAGPPSAEYAEHPTGFWLIRLMDLGFVIPLAIATGIGLVRGAAWATRAAYGFIGVQLLLASAVTGMAIRMWTRGDPTVTLSLLVISTGGAVAIGILSALLLRAAAGISAR